MGVASICLNTFIASTSHAADEFPNLLLGDGTPLFLQKSDKCVSGGGISGDCSSADNVPQMFNWVEIRGIWWPGKDRDIIFGQELLSSCCCMRSCIVLLEQTDLRMPFHERDDVCLRMVCSFTGRPWVPTVVLAVSVACKNLFRRC